MISLEKDVEGLNHRYRYALYHNIRTLAEHNGKKCVLPCTPLAVAKILQAIAKEEEPGIVMLGKQAIDDDSNQTGQMLAALMGRPQGTFANTVEVEGDSVTVKREVDGGLQTVKLTMPAIVTTDLRLNEPRYASLPNIMKAKKKPLDTKSPADYGVDTAPRLTTTNVSEPPVRQAGEKVEDVDALVAKIKALGIA